MRQFSVVHILLLLLMLLVYHCTRAQSYVVTTKGDTLIGDVKSVNMGANSLVQLKRPGEKKQSFSIRQVREFSLKDQIFRPVHGPDGISFMKVIKDGYLSLYSFQLQNQPTYDGYYLLKKDGAGIEVPNLTFKKVLTRFISDCPSVSSKVDEGKLGKKQIEQIVDEYNDCIANRTNEVVSENQKLNPLDALEQKVKQKEAFEGQQDAIDMIAEIRGKVQRNEKVPNFMIDGLKKSLSNFPELVEEADAAIHGIQ